MDKKTAELQCQSTIDDDPLHALSERMVIRMTPELLDRIGDWVAEVRPDLPLSIAVTGLIADGLLVHENR